MYVLYVCMYVLYVCMYYMYVCTMFACTVNILIHVSTVCVCAGGNLSSVISVNRSRGQVFCEAQLKQLLRHIAKVLFND